MSEGWGGSSPWVAVRRHWALVSLIVILGVVAAVSLAVLKPVVYRAEVRMAVGASSLTAQAVPGFALASQQLAANYARYIGTGQSPDDLASSVREGSSAITDVVASPIPESNVLRIEVFATDEGAAIAGAASLADALIAEVNDTSVREARSAEALDELAQLSAQLATAEQELEAATAVLAGADAGSLLVLRQSVVTLTAQRDVLQAQQQAAQRRYLDIAAESAGTESDLRYVQEAVLVGDDRRATLQLYGLIGLFSGAALATMAALGLDRRQRRRRARAIAKAAGEHRPTSTRQEATVGARADGPAAVGLQVR